MTLTIEDGDYIGFSGIYADTFEHGPLGNCEQILVTGRGVNKSCLLVDKNFKM